MNTVLDRLEISSPGSDPYGMAGVEKLLATNTYDIDGAVATIGDLVADCVISCDIPEIQFDNIRTNSIPVQIGGKRFEIGQAVLYTVIAEAGIEVTEATVFFEVLTVNGFNVPYQKPIDIRPFLDAR